MKMNLASLNLAENRLKDEKGLAFLQVLWS